MNVFVLSTGRCGSETFARACSHMSNYTAAHESNSPALHPQVQRPYRHLRFPDQHIEVDNRLSWFLGALEREYGTGAYYVHLLRRREQVAESYAARGEESILFAFAWGVLQHFRQARQFSAEQRYEAGLQYWDTVNDNIRLFLRDKPRQVTIWLHDIKDPFRHFWEEIGAAGDLQAALAEWNVRHNSRKTAPLGWASLDCELHLAQEQLEGVIPPGERFILVDDDQTNVQNSLAGRIRIPFLEREGRYWGPPPDDQTAVQELTRLRASGVHFIAFTHPALWWLSHYQGFAAHLRSHFHRAAETPGLIIYDLHHRLV